MKKFISAALICSGLAGMVQMNQFHTGWFVAGCAAFGFGLELMIEAKIREYITRNAPQARATE